jgi:hypothetical protein
MINEFTDADLDCEDCGDDEDCVPCDPLDTYDIDEDDLVPNALNLVVILVTLRVLTVGLLYYNCKTGKGRAG